MGKRQLQISALSLPMAVRLHQRKDLAMPRRRRERTCSWDSVGIIRGQRWARLRKLGSWRTPACVNWAPESTQVCSHICSLCFFHRPPSANGSSAPLSRLSMISLSGIRRDHCKPRSRHHQGGASTAQSYRPRGSALGSFGALHSRAILRSTLRHFVLEMEKGLWIPVETSRGAHQRFGTSSSHQWGPNSGLNGDTVRRKGHSRIMRRLAPLVIKFNSLVVAASFTSLTRVLLDTTSIGPMSAVATVKSHQHGALGEARRKTTASDYWTLA